MTTAIPLETDSSDYDLLYNAAKSVIDVEGLICEIGVRRGGSLKYIIDGVNSDIPKTIVAVDPYGNIEYVPAEGYIGRMDYTNDMKNESLPHIYEYVQGKNINLIFLNLEDSEFFDRFADGVPVYSENKQIINSYSLVFFDGPHDLVSIQNEIDFFIDKTTSGSVFVFDDIQTYDHIKVHERVLKSGFELLEVGKTNRKISYKKI